MSSSTPVIDMALVKKWESSPCQFQRAAAVIARLLLDGTITPGRPLPSDHDLRERAGTGYGAVEKGKRFLGQAGYLTKAPVTTTLHGRRQGNIRWVAGRRSRLTGRRPVTAPGNSSPGLPQRICNQREELDAQTPAIERWCVWWTLG